VREDCSLAAMLARKEVLHDRLGRLFETSGLEMKLDTLGVLFADDLDSELELSGRGGIEGVESHRVVRKRSKMKQRRGVQRGEGMMETLFRCIFLAIYKWLHEPSSTGRRGPSCLRLQRAVSRCPLAMESGSLAQVKGSRRVMSISSS